MQISKSAREPACWCSLESFAVLDSRTPNPRPWSFKTPTWDLFSWRDFIALSHYFVSAATEEHQLPNSEGRDQNQPSFAIVSAILERCPPANSRDRRGHQKSCSVFHLLICMLCYTFILIVMPSIVFLALVLPRGQGVDCHPLTQTATPPTHLRHSGASQDALLASESVLTPLEGL